MLKTHYMTLGDYQTNCYIIHDEVSKNCCVIDPGYNAEFILQTVQKLGLRIEAILLTHGHFDHVGAVTALATDTDCDVYINTAELSLPPMLTAGKLYYTHAYPENGILNLAGLQIKVIPTPGHTPGSVSLLVENTIFTGDTLFEGSCGRTDLPGGDWDTIVLSLKKLASLEKDYIVYPGHGGASTLNEEKTHNPYIPL